MDPAGAQRRVIGHLHECHLQSGLARQISAPGNLSLQFQHHLCQSDTFLRQFQRLQGSPVLSGQDPPVGRSLDHCLCRHALVPVCVD